MSGGLLSSGAGGCAARRPLTRQFDVPPPPLAQLPTTSCLATANASFPDTLHCIGRTPRMCCSTCCPAWRRAPLLRCVVLRCQHQWDLLDSCVPGAGGSAPRQSLFWHSRWRGPHATSQSLSSYLAPGLASLPPSALPPCGSRPCQLPPLPPRACSGLQRGRPHRRVCLCPAQPQPNSAQPGHDAQPGVLGPLLRWVGGWVLSVQQACQCPSVTGEDVQARVLQAVAGHTRFLHPVPLPLPSPPSAATLGRQYVNPGTWESRKAFLAMVGRCTCHVVHM